MISRRKRSSVIRPSPVQSRQPRWLDRILGPKVNWETMQVELDQTPGIIRSRRFPRYWTTRRFNYARLMIVVIAVGLIIAGHILVAAIFVACAATLIVIPLAIIEARRVRIAASHRIDPQ